MAADDVSQRTIVPMNFVSVVAAVAVLRPQSAPLSRRRSSAPRSRSSRIFRNSGSSSSASGCLRPSGAVRDASTAASVHGWAATANARQRFVPSVAAPGCARAGGRPSRVVARERALRQVWAGLGIGFRGKSGLRARGPRMGLEVTLRGERSRPQGTDAQARFVHAASLVVEGANLLEACPLAFLSDPSCGRANDRARQQRQSTIRNKSSAAAKCC